MIEIPFMQQKTQTAVDGASVIDGGSRISSVSTHTPPRTAGSGPETLAIMAAGASAGYAFMKRKRLK